MNYTKSTLDKLHLARIPFAVVRYNVGLPFFANPIGTEFCIAVSSLNQWEVRHWGFLPDRDNRNFLIAQMSENSLRTFEQMKASGQMVSAANSPDGTVWHNPNNPLINYISRTKKKAA